MSPPSNGQKNRYQALEAPSYFLRMTARSSILCIQLSANFSKILWPNGPYNMFTAQNTKRNRALSTLFWVSPPRYLRQIPTWGGL